MVNVRFEAVTMTACTGVRVVLTGGLAGAFHYKQMEAPNGGAGLFGTTWQNWTYWPGWVQGDRFLGNTKWPQPNTNCPTTGPHLHESGDPDWYTDIYRNFPVATT